MGIFSGLFRSKDKPSNRTVGGGYTFFMGGTSSGKAVTERSAMQMTTVYSCVRILAEAVAGLPLHVYHYNAQGGTEKAIDHGPEESAGPELQRQDHIFLPPDLRRLRPLPRLEGLEQHGQISPGDLAVQLQIQGRVQVRHSASDGGYHQGQVSRSV